MPANPEVSAEIAHRLAELADLDVADHPHLYGAVHDELAQRLEATKD